jgi:hypothetical protein
MFKHYNIANVLIHEGIDLNHHGVMGSPFALLTDYNSTTLEKACELPDPESAPFMETLRLLVNSGANTESYRAPLFNPEDLVADPDNHDPNPDMTYTAYLTRFIHMFENIVVHLK